MVNTNQNPERDDKRLSAFARTHTVYTALFVLDKLQRIQKLNFVKPHHLWHVRPRSQIRRRSVPRTDGTESGRRILFPLILREVHSKVRFSLSETSKDVTLD